MADDECDLETLSALLDDASDEDMADCNHDSDQACPTAENRVCENVASENGDADEADMDTLAAMLEEDSEPEDTHAVALASGGQTDVNADDIAAFFNDASDSEGEIETELPGQQFDSQRKAQNTGCEQNVQSTNKTTSSPVAGGGDEQSDPSHVKKLQDELAMMQQRMMEIQKMLSSQGQTPQSPAAVATPSSSNKSELVSGRSRKHPQQGLRIVEDGDENMFFDTPKSSALPAKSSSLPSSSSSSSSSSSQLNSTESKNKISEVKTSNGTSNRTSTNHTVSSNSNKKQFAQTNSAVNKAERTSSLSTGGSGLSGTRHGSNSSASVGNKSSVGRVTTKLDCADKSEGVKVKPDPDGDSGSAMKRHLFGDDSDSDWEDMDGEKPTLSSHGREIKDIMKRGAKQRQAHIPNYSPSKLPSVTSTAAWKEKGSVLTRQASSTPDLSRAAVKNGKQTDADDKNCITEKKSNIRIINPVMSSSMLHSKMEGRRLIQLSTLHRKVNTPDVQADWVTMGVIVHKSDARKSSNGNTFCILKLSDLQDMNETVSFFLFGQVYKQLWKTDVGTVMGILNPDIMDPIEKNASEVSFTVKNPAQVMMLGQSKDLGWCIGKTKRGNKCSKFVNKKYGEYCEHHVQAAYKKTSSRRGELQGGCPGRKPKSVGDKFRGPQSSSNAYKHNGEYFQTGIKKSNDNKDKLTLAKLQQEQQLQPSRKVTTMSLHDLPPLAQDGIKEKLAKDNDKAFLDLVTTPTVGAMNLVKHIVKREGHETVAKDNKGTVTFQSVQASDLLKEHKKTLQERRQSREQLKSSVPMLGKGFQPGQQIDLFFENSPRASKLKVSKSDVAKLRAIQKIQAKGGLEKVDPNAVRKSSPDAERVKKRVLEQVECESNKRKMSGGASQGSSDDGERREGAPARKKSRLLGDVDLNSEEVQKLLKAKSSHKGALAEAEAEKEEKYFDNLEKREMMEEKMKTVTSLDTTVFTCQQCKYTALSASDRCKQEGHTITRHKGKKRFFACKKCKHRITSLQKFPTEPCKNCGELCFERSTMHREKSGPKLESEILCIRGDEIKYLNSLQQKVYLNS